MNTKKILYRLDKKIISQIKKKFKRIVLCQGHFNVIHPGHLRFLEFAKSHGDYLIVAVQGNKLIQPDLRSKFFDMKERARGVASLTIVDKVILFEDFQIGDIIKVVKPFAYILGEEFSKKIDEIKDEVNLVNKGGGKVIFSSGDISYSTTEYLEKDISNIRQERINLLKNALKHQHIDIKKLTSYCTSAKNKRLLVIGDTIVDQYVGCDALGMSSEAPVLVLRELEHKEFVGGAAIVARHVRALGAKCSFVSVLGKDFQGQMVKEGLRKEDIEFKCLEDSDRPTTFKIRYMVGSQKLMRISRLKDYHINQEMENSVINYIDSISDRLDGIIVSDFGYGLITPGVLDCIGKIANKNRIKIFGDVQSSSQIGNVAKFQNYYCLTPTEKEARLAMEDKYSGLEALGTNLLKRTNSANIILTLGAKGFIAFHRTENEKFLRTQHFPALNPNPVDVVGAGDSLLTALAIASCAGANLMEASVIGAVAASIAISKMGNIPVTYTEIKEYLKAI